MRNFFVSQVVPRLREPSTYAGLAALAMLFGVSVDDELLRSLSAAGMGVGGVLSIVLKEAAPA